MSARSLERLKRSVERWLEESGMKAPLELELAPGVYLALRSKDAVRSKRYRNRERDERHAGSVSNDTAKRDERHAQNVTNDTPLPPLPRSPSPLPSSTLRVIPSPFQQNPESSSVVAEELEGGAREADWHGSERETPCPLDLLSRAKRAGVFEAIARRLKVDVLSVEAKAKEFVDYWTIGGGMGKARAFWMRRLREEIRQAANQNKLPPPGLVEALSYASEERKRSEVDAVSRRILEGARREQAERDANGGAS